MFTTFIKHPTIPSFVVGTALGAVAVFRYNRHMQIFRSNAQELADISTIIKESEVLRKKINQAEDDYWAMKKEYENFFSGNPNLPEYYKPMWQGLLPEVVALRGFMAYSHKELMRMDNNENFGEAEALKYLMIVDTLRETFDEAVIVAKYAVEAEKKEKENNPE